MAEHKNDDAIIESLALSNEEYDSNNLLRYLRSYCRELGHPNDFIDMVAPFRPLLCANDACHHAGDPPYDCISFEGVIDPFKERWPVQQFETLGVYMSPQDFYPNSTHPPVRTNLHLANGHTRFFSITWRIISDTGEDVSKSILVIHRFPGRLITVMVSSNLVLSDRVRDAAGLHYRHQIHFPWQRRSEDPLGAILPGDVHTPATLGQRINQDIQTQSNRFDDDQQAIEENLFPVIHLNP